MRIDANENLLNHAVYWTVQQEATTAAAEAERPEDPKVQEESGGELPESTPATVVA